MNYRVCKLTLLYGDRKLMKIRGFYRRLTLFLPSDEEKNGPLTGMEAAGMKIGFNRQLNARINYDSIAKFCAL